MIWISLGIYGLRLKWTVQMSMWKQNPPDGCRVILAGIAKPKSKSASGTEDFVLTLRVEEA